MIPKTGNQGCGPVQIHSWTDLERTCPQDPTILIASAQIGGVSGTCYLSSTFANQTWSPSSLVMSNPPRVLALETSNQLKIAEADQWNFAHKTWNDSSALAIPLRKLVFVRAGTQWANEIEIDFGGDPIQEVQMSFLSNACTRGDKQGTIPVIRWSDVSWVGHITIKLVLKQSGPCNLGIWTYDGLKYSMFELAMIVVP